MFLRTEFDEWLAEEIQDRAVARIGDVVAIGSDPIDANAVAQILDGTRAQQA